MDYTSGIKPVVRVQQGVHRTEGGRKQSPVNLLRIPYHTVQICLSFTTQRGPHSLLTYTQSLMSLLPCSSPGLSGAVFCPNLPQSIPFSPFIVFWLLFLHFRSLFLHPSVQEQSCHVEEQRPGQTGHCCSSRLTTHSQGDTQQNLELPNPVYGVCYTILKPICYKK